LKGVRNLFLVETIDSEKLALTINNGLNKSETVSDKLKVMIQINTSQEISNTSFFNKRFNLINIFIKSNDQIRVESMLQMP
jgi:uncharacterized pyridoxal phosphate-containing UPF0001 family protein